MMTAVRWVVANLKQGGGDNFTRAAHRRARR
jgi:hypothetical protein